MDNCYESNYDKDPLYIHLNVFIPNQYKKMKPSTL